MKSRFSACHIFKAYFLLFYKLLLGAHRRPFPADRPFSSRIPWNALAGRIQVRDCKWKAGFPLHLLYDFEFWCLHLIIKTIYQAVPKALHISLLLNGLLHSHCLFHPYTVFCWQRFHFLADSSDFYQPICVLAKVIPLLSSKLKWVRFLYCIITPTEVLNLGV